MFNTSNINVLVVEIAIIYYIAINAVTILVTIIDKIKAKKHKRRISEKTLMLLGAFGGALGEYIIMKIIRHKTLHKKFMIGLPCIFLLQLIIVILIILKVAQII